MLGLVKALEKLAALALLAGCPSRPTLRNPHEGESQLTFHNFAGGPICGFYVYSIAQTLEGANRLAPKAELPNGESHRLWLAPGDYQVRATACPYEKLAVTGYMTNVRLGDDGIVVLYREDDAKSNEAAMRIAHEHDNTFLVPAKLQLVKHPTSRTVPKQLDSEKPPL
jgi:hypothetical protein